MNPWQKRRDIVNICEQITEETSPFQCFASSPNKIVISLRCRVNSSRKYDIIFGQRGGAGRGGEWAFVRGTKGPFVPDNRDPGHFNQQGDRGEIDRGDREIGER